MASIVTWFAIKSDDPDDIDERTPNWNWGSDTWAVCIPAGISPILDYVIDDDMLPGDDAIS